MHAGKLVFSQLMDFLPWRRFDTCVRRYGGDHKIKTFPCSEHLRVMAFAQLTYRESLRDVETCLRAVKTKWYHMGIRGGVSRNNLSNANRERDWRIYADFAQVLIGQARTLYADEDLGIDLDATVYALDASTIDLCLSMFPWARFRRTKGAVKMHTLLNLQGNIPEFILISDGKLHDVNVLDYLVPMPGAYYVMDRGYLDFARLIPTPSGQGVLRHPSQEQLHVPASLLPRSRQNDWRRSATKRLSWKRIIPFKGIPSRCVGFVTTIELLDKRLVFLTNDFDLPATTIASLYKSRWQIELFFKWIKQHLRIKSFYGTNQNAVKAQIWIAVSVYLLVAIVKKRLGIESSLYTILQILSVSIFEKTPLVKLLSQSDYNNLQPPNS